MSDPNYTTEDGIDCHLLVYRIMVKADCDQSAFERALKEQLPPGRTIPLRMIL